MAVTRHHRDLRAAVAALHRRQRQVKAWDRQSAPCGEVRPPPSPVRLDSHAFGQIGWRQKILRVLDAQAASTHDHACSFHHGLHLPCIRASAWFNRCVSTPSETLSPPCVSCVQRLLSTYAGLQRRLLLRLICGWRAHVVIVGLAAARNACKRAGTLLLAYALHGWPVGSRFVRALARVCHDSCVLQLGPVWQRRLCTQS